MNLESRLAQHLKETGDQLAGPAADANRPIEIAGRRRRRRRRVGGAGMAAVVVLLAGLVLGRLTAGEDQAVRAVADGSDSVTASSATTARPQGEGRPTEPPETGTDPATGAGSGIPASTGPTLEWSEVDSLSEIVGADLVWTGSYFVAVGSDVDGNGRLARSADGVSWTAVDSDVAAVTPWGVAGSGDALVVWGGDIDRRPRGEADPTDGPPVQRVLLSWDQGDTWTVLGTVNPDDAARSSSPYVRRFIVVDGAAVSGDIVVVAVTSTLDVDIEGLLTDRGLDRTGTYASYSIEHGDGGDGGVSVCLDERCGDELRFGFAELGIDDDEAAELSTGPGSTRLLRSVGGGPLTGIDVDLANRYVSGVAATDAGFAVVTGGEPGSAVYRSPDGVSWELGGTEVGQLGSLSGDGQALFVLRWGPAGGQELLRSSDGGATWSPVGGPDAPLDTVSAGPSGLAVTGQLGAFDPEAQPAFPVAVEKDGFTITWGVETLTVVDADGNTVLDFGPEEMSTEEPPDTVLVDEAGAATGITFLDPETFEPLVTLTEKDLEQIFGPPADSGEFPETIISWSGDGGLTWGWQRSSDAFGVEGWTRLAVGDDVVVAAVSDWGSPGSDVGGTDDPPIATTRLFVATVG
ncbi:MAG: hypothetical protein OEV40_21250 [Acidimicrobiia bacterium]|nr:hypothetical protein [Acidimicrobiia bacterium]